MKTYLSILILCLSCHASFSHAFEFSILSWNVESDKDTNPKLIAQQLGDYKDVDFFALSEVDRKHHWKYFQAINQNKRFDYIVSNSGTSDKLQIVFNQKRFELVEIRELMRMTFDNPHLRGALIGHFKHRDTNTEFYLMLNHLYRSNANKRHEQSQLLYEWITQQTVPVIAVGDYNYDWQINNGENKYDKGFELFTQNGKMLWIKPESLVPTHCDKQYDTILDFVFIHKSLKAWQIESQILHATDSFCEKEKHGGSDHRPILTIFSSPF